MRPLVYLPVGGIYKPPGDSAAAGPGPHIESHCLRGMSFKISAKSRSDPLLTDGVTSKRTGNVCDF